MAEKNDRLLRYRHLVFLAIFVVILGIGVMRDGWWSLITGVCMGVGGASWGFIQGGEWRKSLGSPKAR